MTDPSFLLGQNTTDGINQYSSGGNNYLTLAVVVAIVVTAVVNAIAALMQAIGLWLFKYKKLKWAKEEKALDLEAGPNTSAPTITVNVNTPPPSRHGSPHRHSRHHSDEELHRRTHAAA